MIQAFLERRVTHAIRIGAVVAAGALTALLGLAPMVAAHGAGLGAPVETRLQLPPWVVWSAGALVVLLSFVVVAGFLTKKAKAAGPEESGDEDHDALRPWSIGRLAGLAVLGTVIAVGLVADESILPETTFWLVTWALLPILAYAFGRSAWEAVNPFRPLGRLADQLRGSRSPAPYQSRVGAWPSVTLFLILTLLEVAVPQAHTGRGVASILFAYVVFTLAGMTLFGSRAWLTNAEVFTRMFHWWGAFAPRQRTAGGTRWRAPGRALSATTGPANVAFIVALLYGVNFDGILATHGGQTMLAWLAGGVGAMAPLILLLAGFAAFLGIFHLCVASIRRAAESLEAHGVLAVRFAPALIPIAVGYHAAHNVFFVLENASRVWAAIVDPLGSGWTEAPVVATLPEAGAAYGLAQVGLIVAGHVIAVVVAHRLAFRGFPSRLQAVRAEVPLTLAMVAYTLIGLWIVSAAAGPVV